jgi:hypothetical protein
MSKQTTLGAAQITPSGDRLTIELIQPNETPATVVFRWPPAPSVATPKEMDRVVAVTMSVLAAARVKLSQIRADGLRG